MNLLNVSARTVGKRHLYVHLVLSLVILYLVSMMFLLLLVTGGWKGWRGWVNKYVLRSEYIAAQNQPVGEQVIIDSARLTKLGFVVVLLGDSFSSPGDQVVGASELLTPGLHKNIRIPIAPQNYLDIERTPIPVLQSGTKLYGSIWYSVTNDVFIGEGVIARDAGGFPILTTITLL